jgi:hypothetical protein
MRGTFPFPLPVPPLWTLLCVCAATLVDLRGVNGAQSSSRGPRRGAGGVCTRVLGAGGGVSIQPDLFTRRLVEMLEAARSKEIFRRFSKSKPEPEVYRRSQRRCLGER